MNTGLWLSNVKKVNESRLDRVYYMLFCYWMMSCVYMINGRKYYATYGKLQAIKMQHGTYLFELGIGALVKR